jgi:riboflavin synthase
MFTGIVTANGRVLSSREVSSGCRLTIAGGWPVTDYTRGESIAIDGACLTVMDFEDHKFQVEVSSESLERTTLGSLQQGDVVNLERALRVGDRLGGHFVTGHIDGVGTVATREPSGDCIRYRFTLPPELMRYMVKKGSIAIDGVSLTINGVDDGRSSIEVMIIPHTQVETTLASKAPEAEVNVEVDILGKYVERLTNTGALIQTLHERGNTEPAASIPMDPMLPPDPDGL